MKEHYEVVILGAGPAGSNFARRIDGRKYDVLLVNGAKQRGEKPCGGLVSPDAQKLLAEYDINLPNDVLASPQLFSVKTIDLETELVRYYGRNYINVDRSKFDKFFVDMVPEYVDKVDAICTHVEKCREGYCLTLNDGTEETLIYCDYVVGADGANSVLRKCLFSDDKIHRYVAIQQWFEAGEENPYYSCIFDEETSPSCSWIFFKDGKMILGGAFDSKNCRKAFERQKEKLVEKGFVPKGAFDHPIKTEACQVVRPHLDYGICQGEDHAFLIGEAAGFISASSLEGISFALASGEALAKAFAEEKNVLKAYKKGTRSLRIKTWMKCVKRPFMYHPLLRNLVMKSGITTIKVKA